MADIKNHSTLTTNLVSYWDMEEASGTRYDLHGSNNLTDNNTVTQGVGKIGNCGDFERGNSEYLSITDASQSGLDLTTNASFSMWVKIETLPSSGQIFSLINKITTVNNESFNLYLHNDAGTYKLCLQASGDGTYGGAGTFWFVTWATPVAGTWYHLVFTFAGGSNRTTWYVDGTQLAQSTTDYTEGSFYSGSSAFMIGGDPGWNNGYWDGLIEEVGVWSKELTSTEVTDLYNSGNGLPYYDPTSVSGDTTLSTSLVSYWELEESSGTRSDSHGTNDLTDNNTVLSATGILGTGADFETTNNEYLSRADGSLEPAGAFSFSFWLKAESFPSSTVDDGFLGKWASTGNQRSYSFAGYNNVGTHQIAFFVTGDGASNIGAFINSGMSIATWYHIVGTFTPSTSLNLYLNGNLIQNITASVPASVYNSTAEFRLGDYTTATIPFDGVIDEVGYWTKALTIGEVRALYGYGIPPAYSGGTSGPANLKSYNTNVLANIKSINTNPIANVKSLNTNV